MKEIQKLLEIFSEDRPVMKKHNQRDWRIYKLLRQEIDEAEAETDPKKIATELSDIIAFALTIANNHGLDMDAEIREKIARNILKYPQQNFQGDYTYNEAVGKSKSEWQEDHGEEWFYSQD